MWTESFVTSLDWAGLGLQPGDKTSECLFWTGRDGQMCAQYFRTEAEVSYQPHVHSEYAILVCLAGEAVVRQWGEEQVVRPGEAVMTNPGVEHSSEYRVREGGTCEVVSLSFAPELMAALEADFELPATDRRDCLAFIGVASDPALEDCARVMAQELKTKRRGYKIVIETHSIRLLAETIRAWPRFGITKIEADFSARLPHRDFVRAYEFMRECPKESFRLQRLCRFLGSSEERFTRLFQAATRQTPAGFYNRLLLERARELLRNPKLSIKEVGFELGFRTSSHFVSAFRREYGASPQEHRRQELKCELAEAV